MGRGKRRKKRSEPGPKPCTSPQVSVEVALPPVEHEVKKGGCKTGVETCGS